MQSQFDSKILIFQSYDDGGKFFGTTFTSYLKENGSCCQISFPNAPEQNVGVEREHPPITELRLTMLFEILG